ncbi:hypothetical protein BH10ACT3_BH10ACT3_09140 [soil metagenome]
MAWPGLGNGIGTDDSGQAPGSVLPMTLDSSSAAPPPVLAFTGTTSLAPVGLAAVGAGAVMLGLRRRALRNDDPDT